MRSDPERLPSATILRVRQHIWRTFCMHMPRSVGVKLDRPEIFLRFDLSFPRPGGAGHCALQCHSICPVILSCMSPICRSMDNFAHRRKRHCCTSRHDDDDDDDDVAQHHCMMPLRLSEWRWADTERSTHFFANAGARTFAGAWRGVSRGMGHGERCTAQYEDCCVEAGAVAQRR